MEDEPTDATITVAARRIDCESTNEANSHNMTDQPPRTKAKSLFLAAIMIVSAVAMSAAFAGTAVADDPGESDIEIESAEYDDEVVAGDEVDIDVTLENTGDEEISEVEADVEFGDSNETIDFETVGGDENKTGSVSFDSVEEGSYDLDITATVDEEQADTYNGEIEVSEQIEDPEDYIEIESAEYDDEVAAGDEVDIDVTLENTGDEEITGVEADVEFGDSNETLEFEMVGGNETKTENVSFDSVEEGSYDLNITATVDEEQADTYNGEIEVFEPTDVGHGPDAGGPTWSSGNDVENVYIGQELTLKDDEFGDSVSSVILYKGPVELDNPELVTSVEATDGTAEFDTSDLETGEGYHFSANESHFDEKEFWTAEEELSAEFNVNTIPQDESATLDIDSERDYQHVDVISEDVDAEDLEEYIDYEETEVDTDDDILTLIDVESEDDFDIEFEDFDADEYEFEFEITDSFAWDNATIDVVDDDSSVDFAEQSSGEIGDVIDIELELTHAEEGYIQISEYDKTYFQASAMFEAEDHNVDEAVLQFNANAPNESESWRVHPDYEDEIDLEEQYANATEIDGALGDHDYTMFAGLGFDDESVDSASYATPVVEPETDTEFFSVNERSPVSDVTTAVAPIDSSLDDYDAFNETTVTEQSDVADGDALLVTLEDFGLSGVVADASGGDQVSDHLAEEHIDITVVEQDPGPNVGAQVWTINETDASDDDDIEQINVSAVYTDLEHYDGDLVLQLEYDEDEIGEEFDLGGYDLTYEITEESPYVDDADDEIEIETEFDLVEPVVEWYHSAEEVPNAADAEVSGTTTTAPGSEIRTNARSGGNFTESADAIVEADGTFAATYDFSEYDPGIEFELGASHEDESSYDSDYDLEDSIDAVLVDADEAVINLHATAPGEVEVGDDAALDVTVSNDGGAADDITVTVTTDGETVKNESVTLEPDEEWSGSFDFDTAEKADIDWDVTAGDQSDSGTLNVVEKKPVDEPEDEPKDEPEDDPEDDPEDEPVDDETPGFGVAVAVVALLAAAMLALRRQN
ncbi:hypothetical protein C490_16788 [Natronobacterium gregoryi SP2]|uniref:PGF-CTERM sorting domain-containing protein n=3 Tax=Natronobacterium gregoryi TaxID=44930 RepID=L9XM18_NATGS|nr:hypothetical protein C490_16788 [Natronobacterium gregoryi SP2]